MNISKEAFMEMEEMTNGPWMKAMQEYRAGKKISNGTNEKNERHRYTFSKLPTG